MNIVTFEHLGITLFVNRVAFEFGNIKIYWYAVMILLGVIIGFFYAAYFAKKENLSVDYLYDVLLWGLPSAIIMARIYYVVFNFSQYREHPMDIFKIWEGGIAIYGAVIGSAISTYLYGKAKKLPVLQLFDMGALGLLVGQAIGRWGNFFNQEAFGYNSDSWLAMGGTRIQAELSRMEKAGLPVDPTMGVHPTFLYESLWNLLGAVVLGFFHRKKKHHGQIFFLYLLWYGVGRFFIEGLRTDSLYFFSVRISQVVAAVTAVIGAVMSWYLFRKPVPKDEIFEK